MQTCAATKRSKRRYRSAGGVWAEAQRQA